MRTAAIFVDAGYLFSAGSGLLYGRVHRRNALLLEEPAELLDQLAEYGRGCCDDEDMRVLRTYWYDGAPQGLPDDDQIAVGSLPRVKLRLGRLNAGGQKGVDGLIILDLITLAANRAIDTAILVSGDEDLREAALHAQGFGVSVVLLGVPPAGRQRQSELLVREADHHVLLDESVVAAHLRMRTPVAASIPDATTAGVPVAGRNSGSTLVDDEVETRLRKLAQELVSDPRFADSSGILSSADPTRLDRRADRMLVARIAELTGVFPVEKQLLERARRTTVAEAQRRSIG